jgi:hypothetical protein
MTNKITVADYFNIGHYFKVSEIELMKICAIDYERGLIYCKEFRHSTFELNQITCMGNELKAFLIDDIKECEIIDLELK